MKSLTMRWKAGAVIKSLFGEGLEILDCFGRDIRPKLDGDFTEAGFDDGDFFGVHNKCPI